MPFIDGTHHVDFLCDDKAIEFTVILTTIVNIVSGLIGLQRLR